MAQKISDFTEKSTGLTADAFLPIIDKNPRKDNLYENYKLNVVEYFYSKSEIDAKINELNNTINTKFEQEVINNNTLKEEIISYIEDLENLLNSKADKNLGDRDKVVITDNNGEITTSGIINVNHLNALENITGNIEARLDALETARVDIEARLDALETAAEKINSLEQRMLCAPIWSTSTAVNLEFNKGYKIKSDGWILAYANHEGHTVSFNLQINGITVFFGDPHGHHSSDDCWILIPVKNEDVVKFTLSGGNRSKWYYYSSSTSFTKPAVSN